MGRFDCLLVIALEEADEDLRTLLASLLVETDLVTEKAMRAHRTLLRLCMAFDL